MRMRRLVVAGGVAASAVAAAYTLALRPWSRNWGIAAGEAELDLPGDWIVPDAIRRDTRGVDVDAPPEAVWPWLVQMGYERAGFYGYDFLDAPEGSASAIVPGLQSLEVDAVVPLSPEVGFVVKALEPGTALVLYIDEEIIERQMAAARVAQKAGYPAGRNRPALQMATATMLSLPGLMATFAYVLEPRGDAGSRLIVRRRVAYEEGGVGQALVARSFLFGAFLITRRQMLGIKARAEREPRPPTPIEGDAPGA